MENSSYKVLAIDDNNDNLVTLKAIIMDAFPTALVYVAHTGNIGIELARANDPDVILLDIEMPVMDGFEVCRKIKSDEVLRDIPVVFITAERRDKKSRLTALECGAEAFLTKPVDEIEIIAQIRAMAKIKTANMGIRDEKYRLKRTIDEKVKELTAAYVARKKSEMDLIESEEKFKYAFNYSIVGMSITSILGELNVNKTLASMLGYSRAELNGKRWQDITYHEDIEKNEAELAHLLNGDIDSTRFEKRYVKKDGSSIWVDFHTIIRRDKNGNNLYYMSSMTDITDRKIAEEELLFQNYHDHLTSLHNRKYFEEQLKKLDIADNYPISIIMFDINGLKLINDSFGHNAGDELLKKAAIIISENCVQPCMSARLGGDEFAIILPRTDSDDASEIAIRIKKLSSEKKVESINLSISYGVDTKINEKQSIDDIMINAENDMYRHKIYERHSLRSKTIDIIMNTLFEKSNREMLHSKRVSKICIAIATKLKFDQTHIEQVRIAGLVHDIGKIGIDERILNKECGLNAEERAQVEKHSEAGWRILSSTNEFSDIAKFVLCHHEKWDGSGYPKGLKHYSIPIESRIIAIADTYDAITNERSYRTKCSNEYAAMEIQRCSGSQFDPDIVNIFLDQILPENNYFIE